jgi:hypothetical protein
MFLLFLPFKLALKVLLFHRQWLRTEKSINAVENRGCSDSTTPRLGIIAKEDPGLC